MRVVVKFGGTSLGNGERVTRAADSIAAAVEAGHEVAVVASAMGNTTDELLDDIDYEAGDADRAEIVSMGERTSVRMLKGALAARGIDSWSVSSRPKSSDVEGSARHIAVPQSSCSSRWGTTRPPRTNSSASDATVPQYPTVSPETTPGPPSASASRMSPRSWGATASADTVHGETRSTGASISSSRTSSGEDSGPNRPDGNRSVRLVCSYAPVATWGITSEQALRSDSIGAANG